MSTQMEEKLLTSEEKNVLAEESFKNAKDLVKDAEILFSKRRYARAFSLTLLSMEEMGKACMCLSNKIRTIKDLKDHNKFLSHKDKQSQYYQAYLWSFGISLFATLLLEMFLEWKETGEEPKKLLIKKLEEAEKDMKKDNNVKRKIGECPYSPIIAIHGRALSLEDVKNGKLEEYKWKGFYVGFNEKERKVVSPCSTITPEDVKVLLKKVKNGIELVDRIMKSSPDMRKSFIDDLEMLTDTIKG